MKEIKYNKDINDTYVRQTHSRANSLPKHIREILEAKDIHFDDDDFVDIVEYIDIEIVNVWKK